MLSTRKEGAPLVEGSLRGARQHRRRRMAPKGSAKKGSAKKKGVDPEAVVEGAMMEGLTMSMKQARRFPRRRLLSVLANPLETHVISGAGQSDPSAGFEIEWRYPR